MWWSKMNLGVFSLTNFFYLPQFYFFLPWCLELLWAELGVENWAQENSPWKWGHLGASLGGAQHLGHTSGAALCRLILTHHQETLLAVSCETGGKSRLGYARGVLPPTRAGQCKVLVQP